MILVIRLGALGDFVLSFPAYAAIRAHHPHERITLLTTAPFAVLGRAAPWFDDVAVDARPAWWDLPGLLRLRRTLRPPGLRARGGWRMAYDLQTSGRSSHYHALAGRPPWSGIARLASHPHRDPRRDALHTLERQRGQLREAGVTAAPAPDTAWLAGQPGPALPGRYALLVPGAAPHRPAKRWPAARFGELAARLAARGLVPVVAGTAAEAPLASEIRARCPAAIDLTGRTDLLALGGVAARAALAVGNDTGPMHLAAALGTPSLVLFGGESDPALTAPRTLGGGWAPVLRVADLGVLGVETVLGALPG